MVVSDSLHGFYTSSEYYVDRNNYNYRGRFVDDNDEEDYDNWTKSDLIEHIRRLEREIEQLEKIKACNN